jgi:hypothetical protein
LVTIIIKRSLEAVDALAPQILAGIAVIPSRDAMFWAEYHHLPAITLACATGIEAERGQLICPRIHPAEAGENRDAQRTKRGN